MGKISENASRFPTFASQNEIQGRGRSIERQYPVRKDVRGERQANERGGGLCWYKLACGSPETITSFVSQFS